MGDIFAAHFAALGAGFIVSSLMGIISYRLKALSGSGVAGMVIIGTLVLGFGGLAAAVPLIIFFITSSFLSHLKSPLKAEALMIGDKGERRDLAQVAANGGIGAICIAVLAYTGNFLWFFCYLASICEAAADTWATEIGTLADRKPRSIITLRIIDPGMSGGVTILGTAAAFGGAFLIGFSAIPILLHNLNIENLFFKIIIAALAGFIGSIIDSILGGSIQARYRCPVCRKITERKSHCRVKTSLAGGIGFINNDIVNLLGTLAAAVVAFPLLNLPNFVETIRLFFCC